MPLIYFIMNVKSIRCITMSLQNVILQVSTKHSVQYITKQ